MDKSEGEKYKSLKFMGASGWDYFVPYEANVSTALQRLREDVFARGDYDSGPSEDELLAAAQRMRPEMDPWMQKCKEEAAKLPEPFRTKYIEFTQRVKGEVMNAGSVRPQPKPKPKTIEELLEQRAESGTHSILDIICVSSEPKFGAVSSFPSSKLLEFFGSETPSHAKIKEVYEAGSLEDFFKRWEGIYVIAYRDGSPHEIFFAGCSGD
jgi:hypothetical protein